MMRWKNWLRRQQRGIGSHLGQMIRTIYSCFVRDLPGTADSFPICMMLSVWSYLYDAICMMLSVWCYLYDPICMMLSVWSYLYDPICMIPSAWSYPYDPICMILSVWSYPYDPICTILSLRSYLYDPICMILSVWCYLYDAICMMLSVWSTSRLAGGNRINLHDVGHISCVGTCTMEILPHIGTLASTSTSVSGMHCLVHRVRGSSKWTQQRGGAGGLCCLSSPPHPSVFQRRSRRRWAASVPASRALD